MKLFGSPPRKIPTVWGSVVPAIRFRFRIMPCEIWELPAIAMAATVPEDLNIREDIASCEGPEPSRLTDPSKVIAAPEDAAMAHTPPGMVTVLMCSDLAALIALLIAGASFVLPSQTAP